MRLIDADKYRAEIEKRQDVCAEWRDEAKESGDTESYIRADQALSTFLEAKLTLDTIPTVDAVPVVRCKDCKYCRCNFIFRINLCGGKRVSPDWYCAGGERREDA